ncbi:methyltransferase [Amycolatopsis suaedae]|uniref:Class I SAM-dependent methyltransferase n=1 Tax=Amycolatopsis suaedae TaxID=2510978 RepID=A0A4Q7J1E0_9PSEU|nr:class I SAM-dependent methyltransferase [Amycolatopsis suaedae]RZQ59754.1 class I SAM-dependent methyltransferase [Amycolatopsis suaedae]
MDTLDWTEDGQARSARWRSAGAPPPRRVELADDRTTADAALRLAKQGTGLLWRGDFHNARQLLSAMARRLDRRREPPAADPAEAFRRHRERQARRATLLGLVLVELDTDYRSHLRRAPDVAQACTEAFGESGGPSVLPLRLLQGAVGAAQWRRRGVEVPALAGRIHPHFGVFSPVRGEYVDLVARAPLPGDGPAFDIGTGTGVLAAVLAARGVRPVVGTDADPRALACARENLDRLGASGAEVVAADLFPPGRARLVVCNPPWLPGEPTSALEAAVYDPDSRMLRGFLAGLAGHLEPDGEGWLIMSDLAERVGLRGRDELTGWITGAGLRVEGRLDTRPRHRKAADETDPLHAARSAEVTSLWRLRLPG